MSRSLVWSLAGLAGRSGAGVKVAVIDTGVHADHPHVGGISGGVGFDQSGQATGDLQDRLGHGTAVAAAIREKAPAVKLLAVKVFDRRLVTTGIALVEGIRWAIAQQVQLINLSLGTTNEAHRDVLVAAVSEAEAAGALIVAAAPQPAANWLPGALPGVVAVDVDWMCPRDECHVSIDEDGRVTLKASGYPRPIPGVPPEQNVSGLSFAVANASGFLAMVLESQSGAAEAEASASIRLMAALRVMGADGSRL